MTDHHLQSAESSATQTLTEHDAKEMRRLLHDMNNALEIILQATYLMGTVELDETGRQWLQLLEKGVDQTAALNRQFRDIIVHAQGESV
jgi:hypothetical protein